MRAGDNLMRIMLHQVVQKLDEAMDIADSTRRIAASCSTETIELDAEITRYVQDDVRARDAANLELVVLDVQLKTQQILLKASRDQLSGAKGFENGFVTALTLGIHNPVKENIDRANAAIGVINTSVRTYNDRVATINQRQIEIAESNSILSRIEALQSHLIDCQNDLSETNKWVKDALSKLSNADDATSFGAALVQISLAKANMQKLEQWTVALAS